MTPARAVLAAILAIVMVLAGAMIVARTGGREAADLLEILLAGPAGGLWCFLAAAGALATGALAVLAAFLAFIAREEDDNSPYRRRGFPKSAPIVLIALSLGLVFLALRCAAPPEVQAPIAVAVAPEAPPTEDPEDAAPVTPAIAFGETTFDWAFKDPLIRDGAARWMSRARPFADDAAGGPSDTLLCNKAWVAVTGSASEEGPADRNAARARLRALEAAGAAQGWIDRHPDCGQVIVFAVDLGQHVAGAHDAGGAATAYQRRVLVAGRLRASGAPPDIAAAQAELETFLADPAARAAFLGGRRFSSEPLIWSP